MSILLFEVLLYVNMEYRVKTGTLILVDNLALSTETSLFYSQCCSLKTMFHQVYMHLPPFCNIFLVYVFM